MRFGIHGMAVVFGGRDLSNEFFDAQTDFGIGVDSNLFPVAFDHGFDETVAKQIIGEGRFTRESTGLRFAGTIDVPDKFGAALKRLIVREELGYSTGALGHMIDRIPQRDGRTYLRSWYLGEISCTTNPCEPRAAVELKSADLQQLKLNHLRVKNEIRAQELGIDLGEERKRAAYQRHLRQKLEWQRKQLGL